MFLIAFTDSGLIRVMFLGIMFTGSAGIDVGSSSIGKGLIIYPVVPKSVAPEAYSTIEYCSLARRVLNQE